MSASYTEPDDESKLEGIKFLNYAASSIASDLRYAKMVVELKLNLFDDLI